MLAITGCGTTSSAPAPASPNASAATPAPKTASSSALASTSKARVRVAVQGRPDQAPFELAYRRGYFDEVGIDIEEVQIDNATQIVPQLTTNNIQVGNGSPSASLFNSFTRGVNIRLVADFAHAGGPEDTTSSLMIRKDLYDAGVRSMAGLKGRRLGMVGVGTSADITVQAAFDKDGVSPDSMTKVQLGSGPNIVAALANKDIEAGIVTEPLVTDVISKGIAAVLYTAGALRPGSYFSVLQYSPQFAKDHGDVATRFMQGFLKGVRDYHGAFFLKKDQDATIALLAKYLSLKDPEVWRKAGPEYTDLNGRLNAQELQKQADFFGKEGLLQGGVPNVAQFVDPQFSEAATRVLGVR